MRASPGLTDREIADRLLGASGGQQAINQAARALAVAGQVLRRHRSDGKVANYPGKEIGVTFSESVTPAAAGAAGLSEDEVKRAVEQARLARWVGRLGPVRMREVCRALAVAAGRAD